RQAPDRGGRGAGREADNEAHRSRRVIERASHARHGGEHGSARCQMQKLSAPKFHDHAPDNTETNPIALPVKDDAVSAKSLATVPAGRSIAKGFTRFR